MEHQNFGFGYSIMDGESEQVFLSVTKGFEHGPGIQRDGITSPRMTDPHSVAAVCNSFGIRKKPPLSPTLNPFVQRAGTWTLYHHLKEFIRTHGDEWNVTAIQSNGDLTMNQWHVAYFNRPDRGYGDVCALRTVEDKIEHREPFESRAYRALVKWRSDAANIRQSTHEFLDICFEPREAGEGWILKAVDEVDQDNFSLCFVNLEGYDIVTKDLGKIVDFCLAGKPIVKNGRPIPILEVLDKFQDLRHIFSLAPVEAEGHIHKVKVNKINFGEFQLYNDLNVRRAAVAGPVIIKLDMNMGSIFMDYVKVKSALEQKSYVETPDHCPSNPFEFRQYDNDSVEIFFADSVYPFGAIGIKKSQDGSKNELVSLSYGGLSGRIGYNRSGITQVMFDFLKCSDAMLLDEGFDVFSIVNKDCYSNDDLLKKLNRFSMDLLIKDMAYSENEIDGHDGSTNMRKWPLNEALFDEIEMDSNNLDEISYVDVVSVAPLRSQMRSVLIFAKRRKVGSP